MPHPLLTRRVLTSARRPGAVEDAPESTYEYEDMQWQSVQSPTDSDITLVVGQIIPIDLSGLTEDIALILPDTAAKDELVGFRIVAGNASFEADLITAASGSELNGVNGSSGLGHLRYFINGEYGYCRCIKGGGAGDTDWVLELDIRIPCRFHATLAADITANSAGADTHAAFDTVAAGDNVGNCYDAVTNKYATFRRDGNWDAVCQCRPFGTVSATNYYFSGIETSAGTDITRAGGQGDGNGVITEAAFLKGRSFSNGDTLKAYFKPQQANVGVLALGTDSFFSAEEILKR